MSKTTVLFVCSDNALLGPLAEAYFNSKGRELVRAFSAGLRAAEHVHPAVSKILSGHGIETEGLMPKSLDVFLMPLAPVPDRVISLHEMPDARLANHWGTDTALETWQIAGATPLSQTYVAATEYFQRICNQIDRALDPDLPSGRTPWHNAA